MALTLITGATGTIGYNVATMLIAQGRTVRLLVRDEAKARALFGEDAEYAVGDIANYQQVQQAMQGCEIVHHCAGIPEQWLADPNRFERVNVGGTQNMLRAALAHKITKFVYTSTIDVFYGIKDHAYDESYLDPKPKHTHYERSKQAADRAACEAIDKGLDVVFIHPSAVYGPSPDLYHAVGVNDIISRLKAKKIPLLLPGGFPLVYSEDVAKGHIAAEQQACGERFILSERYISLNNLSHAIYNAMGWRHAPPKVMPAWVGKALAHAGEAWANLTGVSPLIAKGELAFLLWGAVPSSKKAQAELGMHFTPLEKGLKLTLALMQQKADAEP